VKCISTLDYSNNPNVGLPETHWC